jgi:predicted ATPase
MVVLGTTSQLANFIQNTKYIGPLRTIPSQGFLYERTGRITNWADGLAAWDLLLVDRLTLVERTNTWLKKLGANCKIVVQYLFDKNANAEDLSVGHVDTTVRRLLLDTGASSSVLPSEVGVGISQIIPVVVAAIEERSGLTLVEQPEIHVHPAMQVGLGDLFIEATTRGSGRRTLIIETHSEHIILRILRRIRETTENELVNDAPAFSEDKLSVVYVESKVEGVQVRRLRVNELGEFVDRWPKGFFAERMEELS